MVWSLKQKDQDTLAGLGRTMPRHVHALPWVPQQDILSHPSTRAFVTQAGTNSILGVNGCPLVICASIHPADTGVLAEALWRGVPCICVPLFAEQVLSCR